MANISPEAAYEVIVRAFIEASNAFRVTVV